MYIEEEIAVIEVKFMDWKKNYSYNKNLKYM